MMNLKVVTGKEILGQGALSAIGGKVTEQEARVLVDIIYNHSRNRALNQKAYTMKNPAKAYENFKKTPIGDILKKVSLKGQMLDIYTRASETVYAPKMRVDESSEFQSDVISLGDVLTSLTEKHGELKLKSKEHEDNITMKEIKKPVPMQDTTIEMYRPSFYLLESYGSKLKTIEKVVYGNNKGDVEHRIRAIFTHGSDKIWSLELPLIKANGFFDKGESTWVFMPMVKNMVNYLEGRDKYMELLHPFEYLVREMLTVYINEEGERVMLSQEFYDNRIAFTKSVGTVDKFQKKISDILNHKKENPWDEDTFSPIVYFDKTKSSIAKWSFENNIAIDMSYDNLTKYGMVRGVDLLTGSTSTPAVRCKVASNFKIVREGSKIIIKKILGKLDEVEYGDYISDYKMSNAGTFRTSSKRDNSCTIKDTSELVVKQTYNRRVKIVPNK